MGMLDLDCSFFLAATQRKIPVTNDQERQMSRCAGQRTPSIVECRRAFSSFGAALRGPRLA